MSIIPALERLSQEDCLEFLGSLVYLSRPCRKKLKDKYINNNYTYKN